jgi:hypothetical protein
MDVAAFNVDGKAWQRHQAHAVLNLLLKWPHTVLHRIIHLHSAHMQPVWAKQGD